jgi:glutaredoxin
MRRRSPYYRSPNVGGVEPLEVRLSPASVLPATLASPLAGPMAALFEPVIDVRAFAQALSASGTKMYGAYWCSHCNNQKALFGDAKTDLPYVECSNPDRTQTAAAIEAGITAYPTWIFPDATRHVGEMSFEELSSESGVALPMISAEQQFETAIDNLMAQFGQSGQNLSADLDQDGRVDFDDIALAKENRPVASQPLEFYPLIPVGTID